MSFTFMSNILYIKITTNHNLIIEIQDKTYNFLILFQLCLQFSNPLFKSFQIGSRQTYKNISFIACVIMDNSRIMITISIVLMSLMGGIAITGHNQSTFAMMELEGYPHEIFHANSDCHINHIGIQIPHSLNF